MRYFRRRWDETRGDKFTDWGHSTWYFETDPNGEVRRQIESYDQGQIRRYDSNTPDDESGSLSEKPLDLNEFAPYEIAKDEFESVWSSNEPPN